MSFRMLALLASLGLAAPAGAGAANTIPAPVARVIAASHLPAASISFVVLGVDSGRVAAGVNPDAQRSPASTLKLVTTFAGLDLLGPAFAWHTRALADGELRDGTLHGNLILLGGGDPYMTLERWWRFAAGLRAQGLKRIDGDIIVDDSAFALPPEDPGAFDGRPNRAYNLIPDALMVNFQSVEFRLTPDPAVRRVDIVTTPSPVNLTVQNRVRLVPGRCSAGADRIDFEIESDRWDRVAFTGALSAECGGRTLSRVLLKPADYAYGTFVELWRELGGEVTGGMRVQPAPREARLLETFDSLSLGEIVRLTNKFSNNLMARHLLLTIGAERFGYPATPDKGRRAIEEWSRAQDLGLGDIALENGAGLSRVSHISAMQMARTLRAAYHSRYAPEFLASLPLAGIDGTLRHRMQDAPAGRVRLKTGHLDGVSAVAGFVTAASGETYALASMVNDARADYGAGEAVHAALVDWMLANL